MKQEVENLQNRRSMALNERQCSVSEIVLMHESQSQSNRSIDRSNRSPTLDETAMNNVIAGNDSITDCAIDTRDVLNSHDDVCPEKSSKYLMPR